MSTHRYRIMGRFLGGDERLYGVCRDEADEREAQLVLSRAKAGAVQYGRWSGLRLERSVVGEWEPVA